MQKLWHNRWLLLHLLKREFSSRYFGHISGVFWALLQPIILLGVYGFIFTIVFRPIELREINYLPFVAIALWPWLALQESLQRGSINLRIHADLIKKVAFPHEILIYSSVAATFIFHFVGYIVALLALESFGQSIYIFTLPSATLMWIILFIAACGLTLLLSVLHIFFRDVEYVVGPIMQILFFLAPILYPLSLVPENLRSVVIGNPFTYLIERLRDQLLNGLANLTWTDAIAILGALLAFVGSRWLFNRISPYFEDFL